jgi:hypothetical protein
MTLPVVKQEDIDESATPLAAAIHGFNQAHSKVDGVVLKPLMEDEVVAAIRWWKTRRNEAPVTNREFTWFQRIADTRQLPFGADFEVIPKFENDAGNFTIWSVRIRMPRETKQGWTYAYELRRQVIWSESKEQEDSEISWGLVGKNGVQAGLRLNIRQDTYAVGEVITPLFYFRNTGQKKLHVSLPRAMTHSYYKELVAVDWEGRPVEVEQPKEPAGPVGWMEVDLSPNTERKVSGRPLLLGKRDPGFPGTFILCKAGEAVRLRFVLDDPVDSESETLKTGEITFEVREAPDKLGLEPAH